MAPNVSSAWATVQQWNFPISMSAEKPKFENFFLQQNAATDSVPSFRRSENPVQRIDRELAKLREAESKIINERRRLIIRVELGSFRPDSVQVFVDSSLLTILCEEEVIIDNQTTVMKRFVRRLPLPKDKLRTEMIATQMNLLGTLIITLLKR